MKSHIFSVAMIDFMQTRIGEVLRRTKLLSESVAWIEMFTPSLKSTIIREWIQQDQLTQRGVDEDGTVIGYYSFASEVASGGRKEEGTHYTLYAEGDFYRSMFITVLANSFVVDADYQKMQDQEWWRDEILGLTDENLQRLIEIAKISYADYVRRILGIN